MKTGLKKWMLGAALAVGALAFTAAPAQAAVRFGVVVGGPVVYAPPCPGAGYVWVSGYWAGGVWVPGYWNYVGVGPAVGIGVRIGGPAYRAPVYRGYGRYRAPARFRR